MIFYFSATGNSRYAAERLREDGEELVSVTGAVKNGSWTYRIKDGRAGFVFPTYFCSLPSIVVEFLERLDLKYTGVLYVFYVGTYGTTTGAASARTGELLRKQGLCLDGCFDIRMPDTWTPVFDLSDAEKVAETNRRADVQITELQEQIRRRTRGKHMGPTLPLIAARIGEKLYDRQRRTSSLSVDDTCIGCGLCVRCCPVQAIELREKRPVWIREQCVLCLGCLHRCPTFSIQRGPRTRKHGQYRNPHVKIPEEEKEA